MQFKKILSRSYLYYFVHFLISLTLTSVFFWSVKKTEFIFASDEILYLTKFHAFNSLFTLQRSDFGITNAVTLIATLFDRLYYMVIFYFSSTIHNAQIFLYFIKLFLLLSLPFVGLSKLSYTYLKKVDLSTVFFISLWYSFNPLTLIYWQGNAFALTILIGYAVAPLALYFYHQAVFGRQALSDKIFTAILLFLMSFALFLPAVFAVFLVFYTGLHTILYKRQWSLVLLSILQSALIAIPLSGALLIAPYDMLTTANTTVNAVGGETYGSLTGGVLYQLFMWFAWPIYTYWEPRNIFSYYKYFFWVPVMLSPFIFYFLIVKSLIKERTKLLITFFCVFLVFLLFVKGAQPPFGEVYQFLIDKVSLFRIFRAPDNKFSFGIALSLSVLLLLISKDYRKRFFLPLILVVTLLQFYPVLKGVAIRGENTSYSSDRILQIPRDYEGAADLLNSRNRKDGYVMTLPQGEIYAQYKVGNKRFIGDDLLPKLIEKPFVYVSQYSSMTNEAYNYISNANSKNLKESPIRYIVLRRDLLTKKPSEKDRSLIPTNFQNIYQNRLFTIFENPEAKSMIESQGITYRQINPTKYVISFKNIRGPQTLSFFDGYNTNWHLYPATVPDYRYLFAPPLFENTHDHSYLYANRWLIDPTKIKQLGKDQYSVNPDGSINFELALSFKLQPLFLIGSTITAVYLGLLVILLINLHLKTYDKKKK